MDIEQSHLSGNPMSQITGSAATGNESQKQSKQLSQGGESLEWISGEEWSILIDPESDVDHLIRSPSVVSIFRVPSFLKKSGVQEAYVPQIVSLGPYHYRNAQLHAMINHKGKAFRRMTRRRFQPNKHSALMGRPSRAEDEISKLDCEIRESYEENIECGAKSLAMMLCLDGCFILEILRTLGGAELPVAGASNCYEPIFERDRIDYTGLDILNDILKLENQVPLIVLRKLLQLELHSNDVDGELFRCLVSTKLYPFQYDVLKWQPQPDQCGKADHLLGLFHSLIVSPPFSDDHSRVVCRSPCLQGLHHVLMLSQPCSLSQPLFAGSPPCPHVDQAEDEDESTVKRIYRADILRNAGIKFKACNGGIEKIRFDPKSGTIFLPPICITDHTEVLFRNLIALEVCKPSAINYVTCYVSLMDELIDSAEDVDVLTESEVVINYLGSNEDVAKLFNVLRDGVTLSRTDPFQQLKQQVDEHYKSKLKVLWAQFMKNYISSPWKTLALLGAIVGLLLTLLQTIYTMIAFYK